MADPTQTQIIENGPRPNAGDVRWAEDELARLQGDARQPSRWALPREPHYAFLVLLSRLIIVGAAAGGTGLLIRWIA